MLPADCNSQEFEAQLTEEVFGEKIARDPHAWNISETSLVFFYLLDPPFPDVEFVAVKGSAPLLRLRKAEDRNGPIRFVSVHSSPFQETFCSFMLLTYWNFFWGLDYLY